MSSRRQFLARMAGALVAGSGIVAARVAPMVSQSPRYILNPETGVMFERISEGVYRAMVR